MPLTGRIERADYGELTPNFLGIYVLVRAVLCNLGATLTESVGGRTVYRNF